MEVYFNLFKSQDEMMIRNSQAQWHAKTKSLRFQRYLEIQENTESQGNQQSQQNKQNKQGQQGQQD